MKTTHKTQTCQISISEILADYNAPDQLEICFDAYLSRAYLADLPNADDILADLDDTETGLDFTLNVAQRHENGLYAIITNDRSGDSIDDLEQAIDAFGQPIIDFIADACRLLNIPFYPND